MSDKNQPQKPFSRRSFIQTAAITAATLALPGCSRNEKPVLTTLTGDFDPLRAYPYRGWEDLYRKQWTWDKVVRSTHSANCTGSCSWNVYVRNGVMIREEQAADYPRISADLPDYNPRGCQKGACFTEYVYGPQRLRSPLIRAGRARRRQMAQGHLGRSADPGRRQTARQHLPVRPRHQHLLQRDSRHESGLVSAPARASHTTPAASSVPSTTGTATCRRASRSPGACRPNPASAPTGSTPSTSCCGAATSRRPASPTPTSRGKRATTAPRSSASRRTSTRRWCTPTCSCAIQPGTDAALALGVAKYIVDNNLYDAPYVKEQTDLPLLVDKRTNRFVRAEGIDRPVLLPRRQDRQAARSARFDGVEGEDHRAQRRRSRTCTIPMAKVTTVFELMKQKLAPYTLESVAQTTGLAAQRHQAVRARIRHPQAGHDHPRRRDSTTGSTTT